MDKQQVIRRFNEWAPHWDEALQVDPVKINRILDAAAVGPGSRVLDVACGTGVLVPFYRAREVACVLGVDIAPEMCRAAQAKLAGLPEVTVLCADAETAALPQAFDRCVVFNAFPHFSDQIGLLKNLYKALLPGGRLTIAHDRGRTALDRHHESVPEISTRLPSAEDLKELLLACGYARATAEESDALYLVSAVKETA